MHSTLEKEDKDKNKVDPDHNSFLDSKNKLSPHMSSDNDFYSSPTSSESESNSSSHHRNQELFESVLLESSLTCTDDYSQQNSPLPTPSFSYRQTQHLSNKKYQNYYFKEGKEMNIQLDDRTRAEEKKEKFMNHWDEDRPLYYPEEKEEADTKNPILEVIAATSSLSHSIYSSHKCNEYEDLSNRPINKKYHSNQKNSIYNIYEMPHSSDSVNSYQLKYSHQSKEFPFYHNVSNLSYGSSNYDTRKGYLDNGKLNDIDPSINLDLMRKSTASKSQYHKHPFFESGRWDNGFDDISNLNRQDNNSRLPLLNENQSNTYKRTSPSIDYFYSNKSRREKKDFVFSYLYWLNFIIMLIISLYSWIKSETKITEKIPISYETFIESFWLFFSSIVIVSILGVIWLYFLKAYAPLIIWSSIITIPVGSFMLSLYSFFSIFRTDSYSTTSTSLLLFVSFCSLLFGAAFIYYIRSHSNRVQLTIDVMKTSCRILEENPSIMYLSFALLLAYFIFLCAWCFFFTHLFYLGQDMPTNSNSEGEELGWSLYKMSYVFQAHFIFMLLWTTAIFGNIQKFIIAYVVADWYATDQESREQLAGMTKQNSPSKIKQPTSSTSDHTEHSSQIVINAFHICMKYNFGPLCFAGLVLYFCRVLRFSMMISNQFVRRSPTHRVAQVSTSTRIIYFFAKVITSLVEQWTYNTLYYIGITGENFIAAGKSISLLYRRNGMMLLRSDYLSKWILQSSAILLGSLLALGLYVFDSVQLHSSYSLYSSVVFGVMSYILLQFISSILLDIMDTGFLLYVLDLDQSKLGLPLLHGPIDQLLASDSKLSASDNNMSPLDGKNRGNIGSAV